jgi:hypothetical protein
MLHSVSLVRTGVWEERSASIIKVTRMGELGKTFNILGFHGGDYEKLRLLGCGLVVLRSMRPLLVTANVVPSSPVLFTLKEALSSSGTSVLTRVTRRNIPEDAIPPRIYSLCCDPYSPEGSIANISVLTSNVCPLYGQNSSACRNRPAVTDTA